MSESIEQKVELESCGLPTQNSRGELVQTFLHLEYSFPFPEIERQYQELINRYKPKTDEN